MAGLSDDGNAVNNVLCTMKVRHHNKNEILHSVEGWKQGVGVHPVGVGDRIGTGLPRLDVIFTAVRSGTETLDSRLYVKKPGSSPRSHSYGLAKCSRLA